MKLLTFILLFWVSGVANAEEKQVDYQGFSLWLDCEK